MTPAIHSSGFLVALGYTSGPRLDLIPAHVTRNLVTSTKWLVGGSPCGVGISACLGQSAPGGQWEGGHGSGLQLWANKLLGAGCYGSYSGCFVSEWQGAADEAAPATLSPCGEISFLSYVPTGSQPALAFLPRSSPSSPPVVSPCLSTDRFSQMPKLQCPLNVKIP